MKNAVINSSMESTMNSIMKICTISSLVLFGKKPFLKIYAQETGKTRSLSRVGGFIAIREKNSFQRTKVISKF